VEPTFDVCWSCGTSKDGVEDPGFSQEVDAEKTPDPEPKETAKTKERRHSAKVAPCRACGSTRIIPNVEVLDQVNNTYDHLAVVVYGNPQALMFKDRVFGGLRAWICGNCGLTELRVINPEELYQKYLQGKERGNQHE